MTIDAGYKSVGDIFTDSMPHYISFQFQLKFCFDIPLKCMTALWFGALEIESSVIDWKPHNARLVLERQMCARGCPEQRLGRLSSETWEAVIRDLAGCHQRLGRLSSTPADLYVRCVTFREHTLSQVGAAPLLSNIY